MTTIKSYTDLEQSEKLAKILPIESADMCYPLPCEEGDKPLLEQEGFGSTPCWSLAALLGVLEFPTLENDSIGKGKTRWMVTCYSDGMRYDTIFHDNPVDACYEIIIRLDELNLLGLWMKKH